MMFGSQRQLWEKNTITSMQLSIADIKELKSKQITNKIGCGTNITHIEQMLVLVEYNMERMGHKDVKSQSKYNQTNKKIF